VAPGSSACGSGPEILPALLQHRPDVAVLDVRMPPGFRDEGLRAALEARGQLPGLPVLVLSQYVEESYAAELLARRRDTPVDSLTPREREVLALMAEGHGNATIARTLVVTERAVHKHIGNVFLKLGLPVSGSGHRRVLAVLEVLAVLAYLAHRTGGGSGSAG
jgi:DNA-binding NarL/FixJ family response regulator